MFNRNRLSLARKRRRLTAKRLAELANVTPLTITRLERGENSPDPETVEQLARALGYPIVFFFLDDPEEVDVDAVSFRSLSKMSARERYAALSASSLGIQLVDWIEERFELPSANLIDLSSETEPFLAARYLRHHWQLGLRPIGNMISLLEANGVRVLALSENTASVDAFSFWRDGKPFIFLNNFKTAERSRFDAAHELGHLILHRHAGRQHSKNAEREADDFASSFLMPEEDVVSRMPRVSTVNAVLQGKARWKVSAFALAYRLHKIGRLSKYNYTNVCIELTKRGFRSAEPGGIERETSIPWKKGLVSLWEDRISKNEIAAQLGIPLDEFEGLIWNLAGAPDPERGSAKLSLVR